MYVHEQGARRVGNQKQGSCSRQPACISCIIKSHLTSSLNTEAISPPKHSYPQTKLYVVTAQEDHSRHFLVI